MYTFVYVYIHLFSYKSICVITAFVISLFFSPKMHPAGAERMRLNSIHADFKRFVWRFERINCIIGRNELAVLFNQTWLNEIYIYIYIYMIIKNKPITYSHHLLSLPPHLQFEPHSFVFYAPICHPQAISIQLFQLRENFRSIYWSLFLYVIPCLSPASFTNISIHTHCLTLDHLPSVNCLLLFDKCITYLH